MENCVKMETKQRAEIQYNETELENIADEITIITSQIRIKDRNGINRLYDNQKECALKVCNVFNDKKKTNVLVYGKTQTGKTGCMTSIIKLYMLTNNIPIDNIYIITGLSDKAWKKDTKDRMPDSIYERVFHRANLPNSFIKDIRLKKNLLIIMDEIHIACKESQTLQKTFKKCGFYDLDNLLKNDIKLIQFSATPDGNINDLDDWEEFSIKIKLEPGDSYVGSKELMRSNRVKQFKDLNIYENVLELLPIVEKYENPLYHLIRVPNKRNDKQENVINNFKSIFKENCIYNIDYLKVEKQDINDLLKTPLKKHTFIFYCEILRCAKTQIKKYIGISYERYCITINDSTIIQGSIGRLTGYDDNGISICFTNIETLKNYETLWDNNMIFKENIPWNTNTTTYDIKEKMTFSTGTFNSVKNILQLSGNSSQLVDTNSNDLYHVKKDEYRIDEGEQLVEFWNRCKTKYSRNQFTDENKDMNGFYKTSTTKKKERYLYSVLMCEISKWNGSSGFDISKNNKIFLSGDEIQTRMYVCYDNFDDSSKTKPIIIIRRLIKT